MLAACCLLSPLVAKKNYDVTVMYYSTQSMQIASWFNILLNTGEAAALNVKQPAEVRYLLIAVYTNIRNEASESIWENCFWVGAVTGGRKTTKMSKLNGVETRKHLTVYWPPVREIHRSPSDYPKKFMIWYVSLIETLTIHSNCKQTATPWRSCDVTVLFREKVIRCT